MSLTHVQPGDLITAEFVNQLADAVNALSVDAATIDAKVGDLIGALTDIGARVALLEQSLSPPHKQDKDTKEDKEKEKEAKEKEKDKEKDKTEKLEVKEHVQEGGKLLKDVRDSVVKDKEAEIGGGKRLIADIHPRTIGKVVSEAGQFTRPLGSAQPVEHFIPAELRPDLTRSALASEQDLQTTDSGSRA